MKPRRSNDSNVGGLRTGQEPAEATGHYELLVEAEILGPADRVELVGGAMICKELQHSPHATSIRLVQRVLTEVFGPGWDVRAQMPVALDDESEPEPDVAVVPGGPRDYRDAHPARPVLVVEVAGPRARPVPPTRPAPAGRRRRRARTR